MIDTNNHTPRIKDTCVGANPVLGKVRWSAKKSLWVTTHYLFALVGVLYAFAFDAVLLFIGFTLLTICFGHSLGMHRRFIHNSYECPMWLEYLFVHLGVLVGLAGPYGMMYTHDTRDWAQRKNNCHPYFRHGCGMLKDWWWQLHCEVELTHPPRFVPEDRIYADVVYTFMEKTWMLQQLPWAIVFYLVGGMPWVIWGISTRVAVSITGHWFIGYFAHNSGQRNWVIEGAAVQGYNVRFAGWITMGESWHNNHHAFPGSARLGVFEKQLDPGWWVLKVLNTVRLVWDLKQPEDMPYRPELRAINQDPLQKSPCLVLKNG